MKRNNLFIFLMFVVALTIVTATSSFADFSEEVGDMPMMKCTSEISVDGFIDTENEFWCEVPATEILDTNCEAAWSARSFVTTKHTLRFAYTDTHLYFVLTTADDSPVLSTKYVDDEHQFDGDVAILQFDLLHAITDNTSLSGNQIYAPWYCFTMMDSGENNYSTQCRRSYCGTNDGTDISDKIFCVANVGENCWTLEAKISWDMIISDIYAQTEGNVSYDIEAVIDDLAEHSAKLIYVDRHVFGTNATYDGMIKGGASDGEIVTITRNFTPCEIIPHLDIPGTYGNPQQARTCGINLYATDHVCVEGEWELAVEASCTEKKTEVKKCTVCERITDTKYGNYKHDDGAWITVKEPSCANGLKELQCTLCGTVLESESIPSLYGHNNNSQVVYGTRINEKGLKELYCQVCDLVIDIDSTNINLVFEDTPAGSWYATAVGYIYSKGIMGSTSTTAYTFEPNTNTTRSMFVTILGRIAGIDTSIYTSTPFSDVKEGQWYTPYVAWAYENGIVNGYPNGNFGTTDTIPREQIVTILYRYDKADIPEAENALDSYSDADQISGYAKDAVVWAVSNGIIRGTSKTEVSPLKKASRAEIAQIIDNYQMYCYTK